MASFASMWLLLPIQGALLMTLTVVASMYMVCLLHEHHQRVQHVRSYSLCLTSRTSPEARATQSILLLVASFIPFESFSSIYIFYGTRSFSSYLWEVSCYVIPLPESLGADFPEPQNTKLLLLDSGNVQPECQSVGERLSPHTSLPLASKVFHENL